MTSACAQFHQHILVNSLLSVGSNWYDCQIRKITAIFMTDLRDQGPILKTYYLKIFIFYIKVNFFLDIFLGFLEFYIKVWHFYVNIWHFYVNIWHLYVQIWHFYVNFWQFYVKICFILLAPCLVVTAADSQRRPRDSGFESCPCLLNDMCDL